ncbi:MAG TPA: hypothetical protein VIF62_17885 [Labilithrix sp.]|jgi:hypothetical protein
MRRALVVVAVLAFAVRARADEQTSTQEKPASHGPRIVGDVRGIVVWRSNDNYFRHASTFHYDMPSAAPGVALTGGVEIVKRVSILAGAHYEMSGTDRADAHLRVASGAVLGLARWAFFRSADDGASFVEASAVGGFGRYLVRETYVNTALSPDTFAKSDGAWGGVGGLECAVVVGALRAMLGYSFSWSPASVSDRLGGSVNASGHEIAVGLGVFL